MERRAVERLLAKHPDHPGVRHACAWIEELLRTASSATRKTPAQQQLARLHRHGVQPLRILTECAAVWTFAQRNPRTVPDDTRLTYALAVAVAHLAPRDHHKSYMYPKGERRVYRTVTSKAREQLGAEVRAYLALLLHRICEGIEAQAAKQARAKESLGVPFTTSHKE